MRERVGLTLSLRRYAHALLGRWPVAGARGCSRSRADQDADDLAQAALLGFWRAGLLQARGSLQPSGGLRLALLRCLTLIARDFARFDEGAPACRGGRHFPWSPEARALPRLSFESRALLALAALERLDYEDIGAVLDMSAAQALAGLARARAELSSEVTGRGARACQPRLRIASGVREEDLHRYADDLLEPARRVEIAALLEEDEEAARRVEEWRRGAERLRGAFATLEAEPLPATLDFSRLTPIPRDLRPNRSLKRVFAWFSGAPRSAAAR
jgi:DNA-directed RNA polymerase specialized sigma24 family protein